MTVMQLVHWPIYNANKDKNHNNDFRLCLASQPTPFVQKKDYGANLDLNQHLG